MICIVMYVHNVYHYGYFSQQVDVHVRREVAQG